MQARVHVKGLEKAVKALESGRWALAMDAVVRRIAGEVLTRFQKTAPKKSGRLVASAYIVSPQAPTWLMKVDAPYAAVVEFGSRPHVILPRRARVLHFFVGGEEVFAKRVRHPGTKGQFIIKKAIEYVGRRVKKIITEVLRNV